jgi:Na+/H+-dicarboxylate symporter
MQAATDGKGSKLTTKILIGMAAGIILGSIINLTGLEGWVKTFFVEGIVELGGRIFLSSLKLLVVPMVFVSLVTGTASLEDIKKLGRLGSRTFLIYTFTTAVAIASALFFAEMVDPGKGFEITSPTTFEVKPSPPLIDVISNIFPSNPFQSLAAGEMLQIIVFAILFGIGMTLSGAPGKRVLSVFNDLNEIIMKIVMLLIELAPYGVFFLLTKVFAQQGFGAIAPMAKYFFTVVAVLVFHCFVFYGLVLKFWARLNPLKFYKKFSEVMLFGFSTASSNATIPVSLEVVEHKIGVNNSVASFTIPFGATINMDGTAIMQGVATVFVSQAYGIDIGLSGYMMVILTATLASIGTAGVPGVGLVMLAMVFNQVGLPVEGIGLIIGVDRLLDMTRTAINVTGDGVVSCIVARVENQLDDEIFNSSN